MKGGREGGAWVRKWLNMGGGRAQGSGRPKRKDQGSEGVGGVGVVVVVVVVVVVGLLGEAEGVNEAEEEVEVRPRTWEG